MYAPLRRVLLKPPRAAYGSAAHIAATWEALSYPAPPDLHRAEAEFDRLLAVFHDRGIVTEMLPPSEGTGLDSLYPRDAALLVDGGAVLCNMGKALRRGEPGALGAFLRTLSVPILGALSGDGRLEGGDVVWLDARTVAVGEGYRTNAEGIRQLTALLGPRVDAVLPVPLPHWNGPREVLHLMSLLSPVDRDLAVVYERLLPVPFRTLLLDRGITLVAVPDEEFETMACNVLALGPRQCLMMAGNPRTAHRLRDAGATVWVYEGAEISQKGAGGPTCLTLPLLRDPLP